MLNLVNALKKNFPGIADKALESLVRAAIVLYANRHANAAVKRATGNSQDLLVRTSFSFFVGLVHAYRECGWLCAAECLPGDPIANSDEDYAELIDHIVEDWIRGDL
jgi:hypothetical protein